MGSILTNGVFLPAEGERNCYEGLAANWVALDGLIGGYSAHAANLTIHVTAADKEAWNGKADASALTAHTGNTTIHVTAADKEAWNGKADASALTAHTGNTTIHVTAEDKAKWDAVTGKADASALTAHTGDTTIHVTAEDKTKWDAVTTKANDTDVLHKTGDETKAGNLTVTELNATKVNNLNPGSLTMPNLSAGVDISSYITNLNKTVNTFTPPADGWILIRIRKSSLDHVSIRMQQQNGLISSTETEDFSTWGCPLPVIANKSVDIYIYADAIASAYFFPCLGNI